MNEKFDQRLKRLRQEKGLSAQAMATQIGVPGSTYRDWENGRGLRIPPLEEIGQVLAISVTELVTGKPISNGDVIAIIATIEQQLRELRMTIGSLE